MKTTKQELNLAMEHLDLVTKERDRLEVQNQMLRNELMYIIKYGKQISHDPRSRFTQAIISAEAFLGQRIGER